MKEKKRGDRNRLQVIAQAVRAAVAGARGLEEGPAQEDAEGTGLDDGRDEDEAWPEEPTCDMWEADEEDGRWLLGDGEA